MFTRLAKSLSILTRTLHWFLLGTVMANIAGAMLYSYLALSLQELGASVAKVGLVWLVFSLASVPLALQVFSG